MASHRPDRVGDQIREVLSELLTRGAVHDPGIGFITLTRVKVSPDLQMARVYYTTLGDESARRETAKALERATGFLRRQVGERLKLRRVPELTFQFDESVMHQDRVEQILRDLHEEEEQRNAATVVDSAPPSRVGSRSDPTSSAGPSVRSADRHGEAGSDREPDHD